MKKYIISEEEYAAVKCAIKENKDKRIDRRLQVIKLRYEGFKYKEIAEKLDYHPKFIGQLCREFKMYGIEEYIKNKYKGNHRSLTNEKEKEILNKFEKEAEEGQVVTVREIKEAFDKEIGKDTGRGYIYMLLKRHQWRKIMPRSKHPKKASEEEIASSKKLTILQKKRS